MGNQFFAVFLKQFGGDVQTEIYAKQKVNLEAIHLRYKYSTHLGIVSVVIVSVIKKLSGQQNGSDDNSVYI